VLDRDECCAPPVGEFTGIACREKLGVGVVGDDVESFPEEPAEGGYRLLVVCVGLWIAHVAYVGGGRAEPVPVNRCVCIQFRADGENGCISKVHPSPLRCKPAGEADDETVPDNGVVTPVRDHPVVGEKKVGLVTHFCHCTIDLGDHGVAGEVGARHYQERVGEVREEEVVQAGIGEHAPHVVEIRDRAVGFRVPLFQDDNRPFVSLEELPLAGRDGRNPIHVVRAHHDSEWLFRPAKPPFQFT